MHGCRDRIIQHVVFAGSTKPQDAPSRCAPGKSVPWASTRSVAGSNTFIAYPLWGHRRSATPAHAMLPCIFGADAASELCLFLATHHPYIFEEIDIGRYGLQPSITYVCAKVRENARSHGARMSFT